MTSQPPEKRSSGLALCSLLCGLGGLITGFVTGGIAIITGHVALGQIKRAGDVIGGRGMALAGVILGWLTSGISVLVVAAALVTPLIFRSLKRSEMANAINNVRQVKLAMDSFAIDFDGLYPNEDTGEIVMEGGAGTTYSNDYYRQLFLAGCIASESLFWVKGSPVARVQPDDMISSGGRLAPAEILKAGNVHWAYVTGQSNVSNLDRPLLLDSYKPGTDEFESNLWDRKVIVLRVDGSARAMRMANGRVFDQTGHDILSPEADAWKGSGENPALLLKQPQPR